MPSRKTTNRSSNHNSKWNIDSKLDGESLLRTVLRDFTNFLTYLNVYQVLTHIADDSLIFVNLMIDIYWTEFANYWFFYMNLQVGPNNIHFMKIFQSYRYKRNRYIRFATNHPVFTLNFLSSWIKLLKNFPHRGGSKACVFHPHLGVYIVHVSVIHLTYIAILYTFSSWVAFQSSLHLSAKAVNYLT